MSLYLVCDTLSNLTDVSLIGDTMLSTYLTEHFRTHFWAAPWDNNGVMIRPQRVTNDFGAFNYLTIQDEHYYLPTKGERYHVYQTGHLHPSTFSLMNLNWDERSTWIRLSDYLKETGIWFQFYTTSGITVPLDDIYYTVTVNNNLIFAILEDKGIPWNPVKENITFKVYDYNSRKQSGLNQFNRSPLDYLGLTLLRTIERQSIADFYDKYRVMTGKVFCYVNGMLVDNPITTQLQMGDRVEMIYDSNIVRTVEINLNQSPTFRSDLDGIRKYIFTHKESYPKNNYEYLDDCEFYLCGYPEDTPNVYKAVYIHRNDITNVRQLGGCDYSISTSVVAELINSIPLLQQSGTRLTLLCVYRKQYNPRKLPYNTSILHELNKLDFQRRTSSIIGTGSTVDTWRANNLEKSALSITIGSEKPVCDINKIQDVYGYNGVTFYLGKSVHKSTDFKYTGVNDAKGNPIRTLEVPPLYRLTFTAYEYDTNGKLIGFKSVKNTSTYQVQYPNTGYVEFQSGEGNSTVTDKYNSRTVTIPQYSEFRVYAALIGKDTNPLSWIDVTLDDEVYTVINNTDGTKVINIIENRKYPITDYKFYIRDDTTFLNTVMDIKEVNGNFSQNISSIIWNEDAKRNTLMVSRIPYGHLDVFLNGYLLIEGIDYFVNFPTLYLTNKTYLIGDTTNSTQRLIIRGTGFPETVTYMDGKVEKTRLAGITRNRQVGYVNNKTLSLDGVYNLVDDKNLLIKVNGQVKHKDELTFSEDGSYITVTDATLEGKPYELHEIIVPKRNVYLKDTYQFRKEIAEIEDRISNYMHQFKPDKKFDKNLPIVNLYRIFSPLLSAIITDLKNKTFGFDKLNTSYSEKDVISHIDTKYEVLFQFEPYFKMDEISLNHCDIQPVWHGNVTTLTNAEYDILRRIVKLYFKDKVVLSHFIRVGA